MYRVIFLFAIMLFENIISDWKKYLCYESNYSKNTVDSYAIDVSLLTKFLLKYGDDNIDAFNVTKQIIRAWILDRNNKGDSPKSIARGLSALKNLHRFLILNNCIENSDILRMRAPRAFKTLPRALSMSNLNSVIDCVHCIKMTDWMAKRDKALLVMIYSVGLRISEALTLKRFDVINSNGFLNINGKGGKHRMVPLMREVRSLVEEYLIVCPFSSEWLFVNKFGEKIGSTSVQKLLQKARRMLNLPENITPHSLRHTCATHLMENSGDIRGIQELLGHASLNSTQIYADVTKKYIIDTYDKCHPFVDVSENESD